MNIVSDVLVDVSYHTIGDGVHTSLEVNDYLVKVSFFGLLRDTRWLQPELSVGVVDSPADIVAEWSAIWWYVIYHTTTVLKCDE